MAYAYERSGQHVTLYILDPNHSRQTVTYDFDITDTSGEVHIAQTIDGSLTTDKRIYCFPGSTTILRKYLPTDVRSHPLRSGRRCWPRRAVSRSGCELRSVLRLPSATGWVLFSLCVRIHKRNEPGGFVVENDVTESMSLEARFDAALDAVRPGILRDGGDVWLSRIEGPVAYVQMIGACGGCAMATATLKGAIERSVRAHCPEIERVEQM